MGKRKKEPEVIVFEEPKFKKRKSEKEVCRVSTLVRFVLSLRFTDHVVSLQTYRSCSQANHEETAPASLSGSRPRSWTSRQRYGKSRNMVNMDQPYYCTCIIMMLQLYQVSVGRAEDEKKKNRF